MEADALRGLWEQGRRDEALAAAREALASASEDERLALAGALIACADELEFGPDVEEAHRLAVELRASVWGEEHPQGAYVRLPRAAWLSRLGRHDEAERELLGALAVAERQGGRFHHPHRHVLVALAELAQRRGNIDEAIAYYRRAVAAEEAWSRPDPAELQPLLGELRALYVQQGRIAEAAEAMSRRLALSRTLGKRPDLDDVEDLRTLADLRDKEGRHGDAAALRERAARIEKTLQRRR